VTVYQGGRYDPNSDRVIGAAIKATPEDLKKANLTPIEGTVEEVDESQLDGDRFYRPKG